MSLRRPLLFLAGVIAGPVGSNDLLAQHPPVPPAFRQDSIGLDLSLDYAAGSVSGTADLRLQNWTRRPARAVTLLLNRLMSASRVADGSGRPLRFGQRVALFSDNPAQQVTLVTVPLPRPIPPRGRTRIRVTYSGILVGYTETGAGYIKDRVDTGFTILREDAFAFPVPGVDSWQLNRQVPRIDFHFVLRLSVPENLTVATAGTLLEHHGDQGRSTWRFRSDTPVPFLNVAIAPYRVIETPELRLAYFPADSAGALRVQDRIAQCLSLYSRWFGALGSAPRLVLTEIPTGWGSQASLAGGIIQEAAAFRQLEQMDAVYHELAHLWDPPDLDHPSARLNEGLASFLQRRVARELDGWTAMDSLIEARAASLLTRFSQEPALGALPMAAYGKAGQTDLSYRVGMLMFYAMDRALGAGRFNEAIGAFEQRRRADGASLEQFALDLRQAQPGELGPLLDDWLFTTRWLDRLRAGETVPQIADSYRRSP